MILPIATSMPQHAALLRFSLIQTYYYIESVLQAGYVLQAPDDGNGGTVTTANKVTNSDKQLWSIQPNKGNSTITLKPKSKTGYAMDIGTTVNGTTPVALFQYSSSKTSQQWIQQTFNGSYSFTSSKLAISMTIQKSSTEPGTLVILQPTKYTYNQLFNLLKVRVL